MQISIANLGSTFANGGQKIRVEVVGIEHGPPPYARTLRVIDKDQRRDICCLVRLGSRWNQRLLYTGDVIVRTIDLPGSVLEIEGGIVQTQPTLQVCLPDAMNQNATLSIYTWRHMYMTKCFRSENLPPIRITSSDVRNNVQHVRSARIGDHPTLFPLKNFQSSAIQSASIYGVVQHISPPASTSRTDYKMQITVNDPTCDNLCLNFFAPQNQMPRQTDIKYGDILIANQVQKRTYKGVAEGTIAKYTGFCVYRLGQNNAMNKTFCHKPLGYEPDKIIMKMLSAKSGNQARQNGTVSVSKNDKYYRTISRLSLQGGFVDLIAKVVHIVGSTVYIWDGTENARLMNRALSNGRDQVSLAMYPQSGCIAPLDMVPQSLSRSLLNKWVYFRNIGSGYENTGYDQFITLRFNTGRAASRCAVISENIPEIQSLIQAYEIAQGERMRTERKSAPGSSLRPSSSSVSMREQQRLQEQQQSQQRQERPTVAPVTISTSMFAASSSSSLDGCSYKSNKPKKTATQSSQNIGVKRKRDELTVDSSHTMSGYRNVASPVNPPSSPPPSYEASQGSSSSQSNLHKRARKPVDNLDAESDEDEGINPMFAQNTPNLKPRTKFVTTVADENEPVATIRTMVHDTEPGHEFRIQAVLRGFSRKAIVLLCKECGFQSYKLAKATSFKMPEACSQCYSPNPQFEYAMRVQLSDGSKEASGSGTDSDEEQVIVAHVAEKNCQDLFSIGPVKFNPNNTDSAMSQNKVELDKVFKTLEYAENEDNDLYIDCMISSMVFQGGNKSYFIRNTQWKQEFLKA